MSTCTYIMVLFGLISVVGLIIGLNKAPYQQPQKQTSRSPKGARKTQKAFRPSL